jgi:hypothetical protein
MKEVSSPYFPQEPVAPVLEEVVLASLVLQGYLDPFIEDY